MHDCHTCPGRPKIKGSVPLDERERDSFFFLPRFDGNGMIQGTESFFLSGGVMQE